MAETDENRGVGSELRAGADEVGAEANFRRLIDVGIALSAERDNNRLMETILLEAKDICHADGGTLYLRGDEVMAPTPDGGEEKAFEPSPEGKQLKFEIMRTDSLGVALGGTTGKPIPFPPLNLYGADGEPNHKNVATHVAISGDTINIRDAYEAEDFDFAGTRKFDEGNNYRSRSFLTVPLTNHQDEIIGVLQLLNAKDRETGEVIAFSRVIQPLVEALASQAAVALDNAQLLEAQRKLFRTFIDVIATAIDAKSPYTGGHCQRVPMLTEMLAAKACEARTGPFAEFDLSDEDWEALEIAGGLHDCGKVTTPEYVVDKATKLETIYDRIHEIRMRFEVAKREAEIEMLKKVIDGGDRETLQKELDETLAKLDDDFAFIAECNQGGEFMEEERIRRVKEIAGITWTRTLDDRIGLSQDETARKNRTPAPDLPVREPLLADREDHIIPRDHAQIRDVFEEHGFRMEVPEHQYNLGEVYNLCIGRGTLTDEERFKINDHIVQTILMLERLPFPQHLKKVPEYAGGHHEKMDGTGYPRRLQDKDMSIPARIMAIADIFEALTAADRPYKPPKKLSDSIRIMSFMKKDGHIDPDLFELFLTSGVYKEYAEKCLDPEQIDEVDISQYLEKPAAE